jgi:hypothetical protein
MRLPHSLVGLDLRRRYWAPLCRVSAPKMLCLRITPPVPVLAHGTPFSTTIGFANDVLEEFMLKAGATKGRDLRLQVRRNWSGASRH